MSAFRIFSKLSQLLDIVGLSTGILKNNAGGAPTSIALPNDATKFLDGTGVYSTPASGSGAVVAVKSVTKTDTFTTTSTNASFVDITGLAITYTPTSSSNKILVLATISVGTKQSINGAAINLVRGSTSLAAGASPQSNQIASILVGSLISDSNGTNSVAISYLDSPATTSSTTWKLQMSETTGGAAAGVFVNRSWNDTNASYSGRSSSTITIMEVTP